MQRTNSASLTQAYDSCVEWVERFPSKHVEYAARYIFAQAEKDRANPSQVGTGGTPFMRYLKKHRDETVEHLLASPTELEIDTEAIP